MLSDLNSRLARYYDWESKQPDTEYKLVRQRIVELFLTEQRAMSPDEISERIGYSEIGKKGRARAVVYDALRKLVRRGVLVKSEWRTKVGAYIYALTNEDLIKYKMEELGKKWEQVILYVESQDRPVLWRDIRQKFNIPKGYEKEIHELAKLGLVRLGYLTTKSSKTKYLFLHSTTQTLSDEALARLKERVSRLNYKNNLDGHAFEQEFLSWLKSRPIQAKKREIEANKFVGSKFGKHEFDIVEKVWLDDSVFYYNVYSLKKRLVTALDVYAFLDALAESYLRPVFGKFLVCLDAGKSAWNVAIRHDIILLPVSRLVKFDQSFLATKDRIRTAKKVAREEVEVIESRGESPGSP